MKLEIPLMYQDARVTVDPDGLVIYHAENLSLEMTDDMVRVTMPPGRSSAILPKRYFSAELLDKLP